MERSQLPFDMNGEKYPLLKDKGYVLSHVLPRIFPLYDEDGQLNEVLRNGDTKVARKLHDLLMLYFVTVEETDDDIKAACLTEKYLEAMEITSEEIHEAAVMNSLASFKFRDIAEMIREATGAPEEIMPDTDIMYVCTNRNKFYGAVNAFLPPVWKAIYKEIGDYYILPSCVHEAIIVKANGDLSAKTTEKMYQMVREVTVESGQVPDNEKLPVSVYYYGEKGFEHVA